MDKSKSINLKFPKSRADNYENVDIETACKNATISMPIIVTEAVNVLINIEQDLNIIARYMIKKGRSEGFFGKEEFSDFEADTGDENNG